MRPWWFGPWEQDSCCHFHPPGCRTLERQKDARYPAQRDILRVTSGSFLGSMPLFSFLTESPVVGGLHWSVVLSPVWLWIPTCQWRTQRVTSKTCTESGLYHGHIRGGVAAEEGSNNRLKTKVQSLVPWAGTCSAPVPASNSILFFCPCSPVQSLGHLRGRFPAVWHLITKLPPE